MVAGPNKSVERFKKALDSLPPAAKKAIRKELYAGANFIADSMRLEANRGATGNLQASIRVEPGRNDLSVVIRAGGPLTTKRVEKGKSPSYDYALGHEFGTSEAGEQPFFWSQYNAQKRKVKTKIRKSAKDAITSEARAQGFETK